MSHVVKCGRNLPCGRIFLFFLKKLKGIAMKFKKNKRYDRFGMKIKIQKFYVAFKNESLSINPD